MLIPNFKITIEKPQQQWPLGNVSDSKLFTQNTSKTTAKSVRFDMVWVEYGVYEGKVLGMRIHTRFQLNGYLNRNMRALACFYYAGGQVLKDFNNLYATTSGQVAAWKEYKPTYDEILYENLGIFIPYSELHMEKGSYNLKFIVFLYDIDKGEFVSNSDDYLFTYNS